MGYGQGREGGTKSRMKNNCIKENLGSFHTIRIYIFIKLFFYCFNDTFIKRLRIFFKKVINVWCAFHPRLWTEKCKKNIKMLTLQSKALGTCKNSSSTTVRASLRNSRGLFDPRYLIWVASLRCIAGLKDMQICERTYKHHRLDAILDYHSNNYFSNSGFSNK